MINLIYKFTLIIILFNLHYIVDCSAKWNDSLYCAYTYDTFLKLSEINKEINLDSIDYSLLNAALFYQTNKYRVMYGRTEFKYSRALEKAAFEHSSDMGQLKFNDHESIIDNKKYLWQRLLLVGINEDASNAENIASSTNGLLIICIYPWDSSSKKINEPCVNSYRKLAEHFLCIWMTSKGHFNNIINEFSLEFLGCGVYFDKETETFYATQDFSSEDAENQKFINEINFKYKSPK